MRHHLKQPNRAVVFGASEGRYFKGERHNGISVFDPAIPPPSGKSCIHGYGLIPGVGRVVDTPRTGQWVSGGDVPAW